MRVRMREGRQRHPRLVWMQVPLGFAERPEKLLQTLRHRIHKSRDTADDPTRWIGQVSSGENPIDEMQQRLPSMADLTGARPENKNSGTAFIPSFRQRVETFRRATRNV